MTKFISPLALLGIAFRWQTMYNHSRIHCNESTDKGVFMKLTVLTDNNTIIDRYLLGEPALSFYLEDGAQRLLFDTGYSDVFLQNAARLQIDLSQVPLIVFSHGHNDHTCGLLALQQSGFLSGKTLLAHPDAFAPKYLQQQGHKEDIGAPYTASALARLCTLQLSAEPVWLTKRLLFLGQIPRQIAFEAKMPDSFTIRNGIPIPDELLDDTALVYCGADGLTIITGCSHSGICNICAYTRQLIPDRPIVRIIGGFHLFADDERLQQTIAYLETLQLQELLPCHCVSLTAKIAMSKTLPVQEIGSGEQFNWP